MPVPKRPSTLREARFQLPPDDRWAVDEMHSTDEGAAVARAMGRGTAQAISDGSHKPFGARLRALLKRRTGDSMSRILAMTETPGGAGEQSPYRSELTGIKLIIAVVHCVCKVTMSRQAQLALA